jgi:hypothetical protein
VNAGSPAAGRRARTWSATGGRVQDLARLGIRLDTQVTALPTNASPPPGTGYAQILLLSRSTVAVAELAAVLNVPVGVAAAMAAELRDRGLVETRAPLDMTKDTVVTHALLQRLMDGLRAL